MKRGIGFAKDAVAEIEKFLPLVGELLQDAAGAVGSELRKGLQAHAPEVLAVLNEGATFLKGLVGLA